MRTFVTRSISASSSPSSAISQINPDLRVALVDTFKRADDDPDTSVVLLRANGRSFCVGYDIGRKDPARDAWKHDASWSGTVRRSPCPCDARVTASQDRRSLLCSGL